MKSQNDFSRPLVEKNSCVIEQELSFLPACELTSETMGAFHLRVPPAGGKVAVKWRHFTPGLEMGQNG